MKRVRFRDSAGAIREGEWNDGRIDIPDYSFDGDVDVLPPTEPTKVIGAVGNHWSRYEGSEEPPPVPDFFVKTPNTISGHGDTVVLPDDGDDYIFEGELGVVVGTQCKNVAEGNAMGVVEGFTCVDDITRTGYDSFARMKLFDGSTPTGPVVAPADEVPADAEVEVRVNGEQKQRGSRADLVFSIPELISRSSHLFTLERGDVIATGTPAGAEPLADGDRVDVWIEGVGTLEHSVVFR